MKLKNYKDFGFNPSKKLILTKQKFGFYKQELDVINQKLVLNTGNEDLTNQNMPK